MSSDMWVRLAGEDHDGSIEGFEVVAARRALALLKGNLGRERLLDLLQDEIAAGSAYLREWDESATPGAELPLPDDTAAHGRRSRLVLEDGTVVGSISNAFAQEEDGFTARLSVTLPVTCGPQVVEHHLQHFAVEFRNWILRAAAEISDRSQR